jgi:predicted lipid-binding transport protein (Tim44 family)
MRRALLFAGCLPLLAAAAEHARPPNADLEPAVATSSAATAPAKPAATPAAKAVAAPAAGRAGKAAGAGVAPPAAKDHLELQATQITGNRELPKVMYVVPWKHPDPGDLSGRPANSLLDEVLSPVDRDVFQRQNRYYNALKPDGGS